MSSSNGTPAKQNTEQAKPFDPFDLRPTIVIRPTELEKSMWGVLSSLTMAIALAAVAGFIVNVANHSHLSAIEFGLAAVLLSALAIHTYRNPPNTIGLNVSTREYQVLKGSGRFRQSFRGTFSDISGVTVAVEESSHGVSGYRVELVITGAVGSCSVEKHGSADKNKADERAAKLANILNVPMLAKPDSSRK